jgi:hypothetical protein
VAGRHGCQVYQTARSVRGVDFEGGLIAELDGRGLPTLWVSGGRTALTRTGHSAFFANYPMSSPGIPKPRDEHGVTANAASSFDKGYRDR